MRIIERRAVVLAIASIASLTLAGCTSAADVGAALIGAAPASAQPSANDSSEVVGQGMVLQVGDALPQLCLGAIAASFPPQCAGPEITGWDWAVAGMSETASGSTWGNYAVQGTWNSNGLVLTASPIPLALYDPVVMPDPHLDQANPGPGTETALTHLQNEVMQLSLPGVFGATAQNGYLFVDVVHNIQPAQSILDARFGPGVVVVRPALTPVG